MRAVKAQRLRPDPREAVTVDLERHFDRLPGARTMTDELFHVAPMCRDHSALPHRYMWAQISMLGYYRPQNCGHVLVEIHAQRARAPSPLRIKDSQL
jgi:hypothetical protein